MKKFFIFSMFPIFSLLMFGNLANSEDSKSSKNSKKSQASEEAQKVQQSVKNLLDIINNSEEVDKLKADLEAQKAINAKLQADNDELKTHKTLSAKLQTDNDALKAKHATFEKDKNELNNKVQSLNSEIGELKTQMNALDVKIKGAIEVQKNLNDLLKKIKDNVLVHLQALMGTDVSSYIQMIDNMGSPSNSVSSSQAPVVSAKTK